MAENDCCPEYKAYLVTSRSIRCTRHDDASAKSSLGDDTCFAAVERRILRGYGFKDENAFWGKAVDALTPSRVRLSVTNRELDVLAALIRANDLLKATINFANRWNVELPKDPPPTSLNFVDENKAATFPSIAAVGRIFVAPQQISNFQPAVGVQIEKSYENSGRSIEAKTRTKMPIGGHTRRLLHQLTVSLTTITEVPGKADGNEIFRHDSPEPILGSVGDRNGFIRILPCPPDESSWLWNKTKTQKPPQATPNRSSHVRASAPVPGSILSHHRIKFGSTTLLQEKCDNVVWNWNGSEWIGAPNFLFDDSKVHTAATLPVIRQRRWTDLAGGSSLYAQDVKKSCDTKRKSRISIRSEKQRTIALNEEKDSENNDDERVEEPNRMEEFRRRFEEQKLDEDVKTPKASYKKKISINRVKAIWDYFKGRSVF